MVSAQYPVERQNRAAGETEYRFDSLVQQRFANYVAACQCRAHFVSCFSWCLRRMDDQRLCKIKILVLDLKGRGLARGTTFVG
jgi:hypothetical protein